MTEIQLTPQLVSDFHKRVKRSNDCWEWMGSTVASGYGRIKVNGVSVRAHRLSYVIHNGRIPAEKIICHTCDNRLCVNPDHLYAGTSQDNARDREDHGNAVSRKGSLHPYSKLTEREVLEIRKKHTGRRGSLTRLAEKYNVCQATIYYIVNGKTWTHV